MEDIFKETSILKEDKFNFKKDIDIVYRLLESCYNDTFTEFVSNNIQNYREIKYLVDNLNILGYTFWSSDSRLLLTEYGQNILLKIHSKLL